MEKELQHLFHEHPLILKAEEPETNDGTHHFGVDRSCNGCSSPILGPFYSCGKCRYFLHKVCAELPKEINHPMHPQHPLTFLSKRPNFDGRYICDLCRKLCKGFVYHCSICKYDVDTICAATSHPIKDKCHMHPLIPIQTPTSFPCHICLKKKEGESYKCTLCPFWVHQSCTLLPNIVKRTTHRHPLTLLPALSYENRNYSINCDICHAKLFSFQCSYSCEGCLFFAHISCARSETKTSSSRDLGIEVNRDSGQRLPMQQKSTELISRFVDNYIGQDANMGNKINNCEVQSTDTNIDNEIDHFDHAHPLFLIDEQMNEKTCDACAIPISPPSYGCINCNYFLHKCCTKFPKHILHSSHPQRLTLKGTSHIITCYCCNQKSNGCYYSSSVGKDFRIDIKCGSLVGPVYHEAHKHPLTPKLLSFNTCSACDFTTSQCLLQCDTCSFILCFMCAMAPPVIKHRYGKSDPFILTYSPPENHYNEYLCEICEEELNPKNWFYHCVFADQFAHIYCMIGCGADSNIKYGKSDEYYAHEHGLTTISCTYDCSPCSYCREPLRTGFSVGLECRPCNFRIHLECVYKGNPKPN